METDVEVWKDEWYLIQSCRDDNNGVHIFGEELQSRVAVCS